MKKETRQSSRSAGLFFGDVAEHQTIGAAKMCLRGLSVKAPKRRMVNGFLSQTGLPDGGGGRRFGAG